MPQCFFFHHRTFNTTVHLFALSPQKIIWISALKTKATMAAKFSWFLDPDWCAHIQIHGWQARFYLWLRRFRLWLGQCVTLIFYLTGNNIFNTPTCMDTTSTRRNWYIHYCFLTFYYYFGSYVLLPIVVLLTRLKEYCHEIRKDKQGKPWVSKRNFSSVSKK